MKYLCYVIFAFGLFVSLPASAAPPDFTELVEDVVPAVVYINTTRYGERPSQQQGEPTEQDIPELFRRFFELPYGQGPGQGRPDMQGGGSGIIISEDGLIVTNHHVIDQADEIVVSLADRREFEAELVGSDAASDIALLRIDANDLPVLEFGDSEVLKPGEWVIAVGSPFGYASTVTAGIVSAKGRSARGMQQQYVPFIQTDVAINRGNSGGPLVNMQGEVVGVNSWILSSHGGNIGLSFSIPIEIARSTVEQLRQYGRVSRGLLGVNIQEVDRELADNLGLDRPVGALVSGLNPGSAAERAGIEIGDVIMEFDGRQVETSAELPPMVGAVRPGTEVEIVVWRDQRQRTLTAELDELENEVDETGRGRESGPSSDNALGLTVQPIGPDERRRLGDPEGGVLVTGIDSDRAYRAGVRAGQVILSINNQTVSGMEDFREIVDDIDTGRSVALLIWQNGQTRFIAYTPEA